MFARPVVATNCTPQAMIGLAWVASSVHIGVLSVSPALLSRSNSVPGLRIVELDNPMVNSSVQGHGLGSGRPGCDHQGGSRPPT